MNNEKIEPVKAPDYILDVYNGFKKILKENENTQKLKHQHLERAKIEVENLNSEIDSISEENMKIINTMSSLEEIYGIS